ncbi:MAG: hypothetical protein AAF191_17075 [Verrucomicrobiota bacterium]
MIAPQPLPPAFTPQLAQRRFEIQVNLEGLGGGRGNWEAHSDHDTVMEAVRGCSEVMTYAKRRLGIALQDHRYDALIEPWIRVMDAWKQQPVIWADGSRLHEADDAVALVA